MAATNGDSGMQDVASKATPGTIVPPTGLQSIIEKTAGFVARRGLSFETQIRDNEGMQNKMSFLNPDDAYHAYYRWRYDENLAGRGNVDAGGAAREVSFQGKDVKKAPEKPEEFKFSARVPNISAQDLDVVKLTALYTAKMGRSWMTQLSQREAGNYQFDFLRPQHTLYQFFSRLVDQYTDLLTGDSANNGEPQRKRVKRLEQNVSDRYGVLERAKKRAEYVRYEEAQKVKKEEDEEKQRVEYAQIDWHDFTVVETVVFDERDDAEELPAPITKNDLESASLEQKAAMSINPNRRIEEAFPSMNDYSQFYGQQQQQQSYTPQPAAPAVGMPPPQMPYQPTPPQAQQAYFPPTQPNQPTNRADTLQADRERARAAQEAARAQAPMKIRNDYVPRAQQKRQAQNTSICPNCKQAIPNDEFEAHLRIEMLSPEWREQSAKAAHRSSTTNLSTQEVANNLKRLASQRPDMFDPVTGQALSEEELARRKRVEVGSYDGVSAAGPGVGPGQDQQQQQSMDVQEQIRQLQNRYRG